jgi:hypothetical protein
MNGVLGKLQDGEAGRVLVVQRAEVVGIIIAAALGYRPARCLGAAWSQPNARHLRRRTHANFTRKTRRERQPCQSNGACTQIGKEYSDGGAERVLARRRRMAVSVSVQFEARGQPVSGAGGPITEPIPPGFADLGQSSFL